MSFAMIVLASVIAWSAGVQNVETPITLEFSATKIKLTFANYDGSVVTPSNCEVFTSDDGTKFKIVGPTPVLTSTSTSTSTNISNSERTAMGGVVASDEQTLATSSGPTGKVSAVTDLANSSGAEFFYFCTNSSVTSSTSYTDPGTVYWTSTADDTLETWYDVPTTTLNLYSCFMTPNYTGTEVDSNNCYNGTETQIVISNSVENILYRAFYKITTITNVAIPQSIKNVGYGESNTSYGAFQYCSGLTKVDLPNSVTALNYYAFYECTGLTSINIPNNVTSIGGASLHGCSSLTGINIPSGVTSIGSSAFSSCTGLTSITIPDSVTSIGEYAFQSCTGLTSANIPSSAMTIGQYAFYNCSKITSELIIPDSVTSIGNYAFYGCSGLTSVTIGSGVTSIGYQVFYNCSGLESISVASGSTTYYSLDNCLIETSSKTLIRGCNNSTIPNDVTRIGGYAFSSCSSLTSITIPDSVEYIGSRAFGGCSNLVSAVFTDGVEWQTTTASNVDYVFTVGDNSEDAARLRGDAEFEYAGRRSTLTQDYNEFAWWRV